MSILPRIKSRQTGLLEGTEKLPFLGPALIRLTVGLVFVRTRRAKLKTLDDVTESFATLRPPPAPLRRPQAVKTTAA